MSKLIIGIFVVIIIIIIIAVGVLFFVHVEKLIIDQSNNKFTIALCGTCNGPAMQFGGDVTGMLRFGKYSPNEFVAELSQIMNSATELQTGVANEWNVTFNSDFNTISILSNARRAWTFKSVPNSFYQIAGLSAAVDNFWVFWNGAPGNSTFTGTQLTTQSLPLVNAM